MPGVGVGGLISNLLNPGMDQQLARSITPNPNPLAQGQPGAPTVDQLGNPTKPPPTSNLAPAAVTQPDPVNANMAEMLLKAHRQDQLSNDLNKNLAGVAAGFGTAQQQQSKTAALSGMGGPDDTLGALAKIQQMQDVTRDDNEHARFMSSAATFAQTLSQSLGRPVSVEEATTIMNSPELMKSFGGAVGANAQTPDKLKEADAEARAWADAHPSATPAEIAQHKSDFLAQTAGGLSSVGKQLAEDRRNWHNDPANKGKTDAEMIAEKPELADEVTYVAMKGEQGKEAVAAGVAKVAAKTSFTSVDPQWQQIEDNLTWLSQHKDKVQSALAEPDWATTGQIGRASKAFNINDKDVLEAKRRLDWLKNEGFTQEFKGTKNVRSNTEANKLGATFSNLFSNTIDEKGVSTELDRLSKMVHDGRANIMAAAGQAIPSKYSDANIDPDYLDPKSPLYNGATRQYEVPTQAEIDKLKSQPNLAGDFDRMFGPGSSKRVLGQ